MKVIAKRFDAFARKWNMAANVAKDPDELRVEANVVLRRPHIRRHAYARKICIFIRLRECSGLIW